MAQHWRRVLNPHSPFGLVARVSATHKRDQTVAGPPQSPTRSLEGSREFIRTDTPKTLKKIQSGLLVLRPEIASSLNASSSSVISSNSQSAQFSTSSSKTSRRSCTWSSSFTAFAVNSLPPSTCRLSPRRRRSRSCCTPRLNF